MAIPLGYKCRNSTGVPPFRQSSFGSYGFSLSFPSVRGLCWISMGGSRLAFGILQSPLPLVHVACVATHWGRRHDPVWLSSLC